MTGVAVLAACVGLGAQPGKVGSGGPGELPGDVIRIQQIFELIEQSDQPCELPSSVHEEFDRLMAESADVNEWIAASFEEFPTQRQRVVVATMFALSREGRVIPEFVPLLSRVVRTPSHEAYIFGLYCL